MAKRRKNGDVCERRQWRMKRAIRSGSGQNLASEMRATNFGHRNRTGGEVCYGKA